MIASVEVVPDLRMVNQHGAVAVDVHDVDLRRAAVTDVGDVAQQDDGAVHCFDRKIIELVDLFWAVVELNGVFERSDLLRCPQGMIWSWAESAVSTSCADSPRACRACESISICT